MQTPWWGKGSQMAQKEPQSINAVKDNNLLGMRENTELECPYDGERLNSLVMRDWKVCLCTEADDEPDYQQVWVIKQVRCGWKPSPHRHIQCIHRRTEGEGSRKKRRQQRKSLSVGQSHDTKEKSIVRETGGGRL